MRYDAFISYSHTQDMQLAEALETGLQRLAKPWRRRRAMEVFRDSSDLSIAPGLWSSIAEAMDQSEWLVLMASPHSVESSWVGQELGNFLATHSADHILLVQTDGEVVWDHAANDFDLDQSTAIPAALTGVFAEEPKFLDLRWAHTDTHLDLQHARFKDAVAEVAAPIHGVAKDELIGEDVRLFHRAQRLRRLAIGTMAVLTIAATTLGLWAQASASRAQRAEHTAIANEELAESEARRAEAEAQRALVAEADAIKQQSIAEQEAERALAAEADALRQADIANAAKEAEESARLRAEAAAEAERLALEESLRQQQLAEESATEALRQQGIAEGATAEALVQQSIAELNAAEAQRQEGIAVEQVAISLSRQLAANALNLRDTRLDRSLLLAVESYTTYPTAEALDAIFTTLDYKPELSTFLNGIDAPVTALAISPSGRLAVGASGGVRVFQVTVGLFTTPRALVLWDLVSGDTLHVLSDPGFALDDLGFSGETTVIGLPSGGPLEAWTIEEDRLLTTSSPSSVCDLSNCQASSSDGTLVAIRRGFIDGTVSIASTATSEEVAELAVDGFPLAFDTKNTMLAVRLEGQTIVEVWEIAGTKIASHDFGLFAEQAAFTSTRSLMVSTAGTVYEWDPVSNIVVSDSVTGGQRADELAVDRNGSIWLSGDLKGDVAVWRPGRESDLEQTAQLGNGASVAAASRRASIIAVATSDYPAPPTLVTFDGSTAKELGRLINPHGMTGPLDRDPVTAIAVSDDGRHVATGSSTGEVAVWTTELELVLAASIGDIDDGSHTIVDVDVSPDGAQVVVAWAEAIQNPVGQRSGVAIWDIASGVVVRVLVDELQPDLADRNLVSAVRFSPLGTLLAVTMWDGATWLLAASDHKPVADMLSGRQLSQFDFITAGDVEFTPDGNTLVTAVSSAVGPGLNLWDISDPTAPVLLVEGFGPESASRIAVTPDGAAVVALGEHATWWDAHTGREVAASTTLLADSITRPFVVITAQSPAIGAIDSAGTFRYISYGPAVWAVQACDRARRDLTAIEWAQFVGDDVIYHTTCP